MENKIIIFLMGPPGSGKTTQAEKLAQEFGLVHFITSEFIKNAIYDPAKADDPIIQREKYLYESGLLNTDDWVVDLVIEETKKLEKLNKGIIYSGSPKRLAESEVLIKELEPLYGRGNLFAFFVNLGFDEAFKRIKSRRLCSKCGLPLLAGDDSKICKKCGGEIIIRTIDDPKKFKLRFDVYIKKTEPAIEYFREKGLLFDIDGRKTPEEVHKEISDIIKSRLK